jgi:prephenate dehydrogenase
MTVQITIIGLGQIGASFGLALAGHTDKVTRLGNDQDPNVIKQALAIGAVDKVTYNLPNSVDNADIVLLALPFDQIKETVTVIAPYLQENAVVMDTSPVKGAVAGWMKELLPPNRHYVGLIPAINPHYLLQTEKGIQAAHPDLFSKGLMAISAPEGTVSAAIKLATDLSALVEGIPYFVDPLEVEGMMAALHILPQLTAAALTNVIVDRPGWTDARKLAGRVFSQGTVLVDYENDEDTLVKTIFQNHENIVRVLDEIIAGLDELREVISGQEQATFINWMERARQGHFKWWKERNAGDWQSAEFKQMGIPKDTLWKRLFGNLEKLFGSPPKTQKEVKK